VFSVEFQFADGQTLTLPVGDGQTVLEAAMAADAPIRYDCASGTCGACVAQCTAGETVLEADAPLPISPAELAAGLRPTCLTRLASDARFQLSYPLSPAPSEPRRLKGRIAELGMVAETVHRLVVTLERADDLVFQPGQYLRLRPPGAAAARAYSIASTPDALPSVELLIRHVPGGAASEWLKSAAAPGDALTLQGPLGSFGLDIRARRHVFIAGGTGLAPGLSMLRSLPQGHEALLCFGCTRPEDLFHFDELTALAAGRGAIAVRVALMDPGVSTLPAGTAVSLLTQTDIDDPAAVFYLCGPPPMVEASRARLAAAGVGPERIHAERFAPGG
jgi:benzoate/toluate 1,2-dioxygenase reductase subunit